MNADFPRILTLLRKEKGISQKTAASHLGISQALLSHFEKGIRECGLDFLVRTANYYGVSCDYLLGRSPDRNGTTLTVEDIPEPDAVGKENVMHGSILFDLLQKSKNKALIQEVSSFLMMAVYRVFRIVYSANPKNQNGLFTVPKQVASHYAPAAMAVSEANAAAVASGDALEGQEPLKEVESLAITSESLNQTYPMFASSLMNLIQNSESKITKEK